MADSIRKPILDRAAALLAGPFLLGREALAVLSRSDADARPEPLRATPLRPSITPPEHAIKRRG
jgi:hypothetical protein